MNKAQQLLYDLLDGLGTVMMPKEVRVGPSQPFLMAQVEVDNSISNEVYHHIMSKGYSVVSFIPRVMISQKVEGGVLSFTNFAGNCIITAVVPDEPLPQRPMPWEEEDDERTVFVPSMRRMMGG